MVVTAIVGGTSSKLSGGKFSNGAVTAAAGYIFNFMQNEAREMGYGERRDALIEEIMSAYDEEYGFSGQEAKMSLKRMFSYNKSQHGEAEFIDGLDSMTDEQIQLGLRVATVMTLTGEAHELLAKLPIIGGLGGVRSMTRTLIKEGHFDLQDIKSNINDNFDDLGTGGLQLLVPY